MVERQQVTQWCEQISERLLDPNFESVALHTVELVSRLYDVYHELEFNSPEENIVKNRLDKVDRQIGLQRKESYLVNQKDNWKIFNSNEHVLSDIESFVDFLRKANKTNFLRQYPLQKLYIDQQLPNLLGIYFKEAAVPEILSLMTASADTSESN